MSRANFLLPPWILVPRLLSPKPFKSSLIDCNSAGLDEKACATVSEVFLAGTNQQQHFMFNAFAGGVALGTTRKALAKARLAHSH
jgi:hypothetical protein